jgi:hypothetical protein
MRSKLAGVWVGVLLAVLAWPSHLSAQSAQPAAGKPQLPIRYLDLTRNKDGSIKEDGWGASQLLAVQASRGRKIVVISYLDPPNTRALYDAAVPYTQPPHNLPIVGFIRSPGVPATMTADTPNPLGFDIFFNGAMLTRNENPDPDFSRLEHFDAFLRSIERHYFPKPK